MKQRKNSGVRLLALLLCCAALGGCVKSVRPNERAVVQAIGLDRREGEYRMTLQIFEAAAEPGKQLRVVQTSGSSMSGMLSDLAVRQGKQMFLGNLRLAVAGERVAEEGLGSFLEFLNDFHQIPPTLPVAVAQGTAEELLRAGEKDPSCAAEALVAMLTNAQKTGEAPSGTLMETLADLHSEHVSASLPLLALAGRESAERPAQEGGAERPALDELISELIDQQTPPEQAAEQETKPQQEAKQPGGVVLSGAGLFRGERLERQLEKSAARGLGWLGREMEAGVVSLREGGSVRAVVAARPSRVRITPVVTGDSIVFQIQIKARAGVTERQTHTPDDEEYLAGLLESAIRTEVEQSLALSGGQGLDPVGLSRLVKQREADFYRAHADDWAQVMRAAGYSVKVTCTVKANGAAADKIAV